MNATHNCYGVYTLRLHMNEAQTNFLAFYSIFVNGIVNFVLNLLVIYSLWKTNQMNTPALRIITYLSISDVCISLTTPPIMTVLFLKYPGIRNCTWETIASFSNTFFGHISGMLICVTSYDRYVSLRYPIDYKVKMSARKVNLFGCLMVAAAFLSSLSYTFGSIYHLDGWLGRVVVFIDLIFLISGLTFYILTRRISRRRAKYDTNNRFGAVNQKIILFTSRVLKSILVFCVIYILTSIIHNTLYKRTTTREMLSWLEFLQLFSILIVLTNSIVNALIVLVMNRKVKMFLKTKIMTFLSIYLLQLKRKRNQ